MPEMTIRLLDKVDLLQRNGRYASLFDHLPGCSGRHPVLVENRRMEREMVAWQQRLEVLGVNDTESANASWLGIRANLNGLVRDEVGEAQRQLTHGLDLQHAWIHGLAREMPSEDRVVRIQAASSPDPSPWQVNGGHAVHEAHWRSMRNQPLDLRDAIPHRGDAFRVGQDEFLSEAPNQCIRVGIKI